MNKHPEDFDCAYAEKIEFKQQLVNSYLAQAIIVGMSVKRRGIGSSCEARVSITSHTGHCCRADLLQEG